jgi:O-antigen biosynthesis protein
VRATVVIPTRDHADLVAMVHATLERSGVDDIEAILVDNGTCDPAAKSALKRSPHDVLRADIPFNFPRLVNRGAHRAEGDVIVLLNNDVEARADGWLRSLLKPLADPDVGVVGSILQYPSGRIQHAGIDLRDGAPHHVHAGTAWDALPASVRSEVTEPRAVTGACMAVRADLWRSLGGMSTPLATNYNDVDLCLRARRSGARVACAPFRGLVHHESESRGAEPTAEIAADWLLFRSRWAGLLRSS